MPYRDTSQSFATRAIHHGQDPERWGNSMGVVPPITTASTFKQRAPAEFKRYNYARTNNPTREALEVCLAGLEETQFCYTFSSGLAGFSVLLHLLDHGDHVVSTDDVYAATSRSFNEVTGPRMKIDFDYVDCTDLEAVAKAIKPHTKMVWLESPANPMMRVVDIQAIAELAHSISRDVIVIVDNTFLTPYFQRPMELGADLVTYSLSKYMNGHTDVVMGAVMGDCPRLEAKLKFLQNAIGCVPSPFDCYLVNRSLKTLALRMEQHQRNGQAVGKFLESHGCIEKLLHPGMDSHPQRELVLRQQYGHSGMMSFYLRGGLEEAKVFLSSLKLIILAESLGGYESLVQLPCLMTHVGVSDEDRFRMGVTDNFIRLSVGLEDAQDLIADLDQALQQAFKDKHGIRQQG